LMISADTARKKSAYKRDCAQKNRYGIRSSHSNPIAQTLSGHLGHVSDKTGKSANFCN